MGQALSTESSLRVGELFHRLDASRLTARHIGLYILVVLAQMFDGFAISMIGYTLAGIVHTFRIAPAEAGFLASGTFVGMAIGAFVIGPLTDRVGRKPGFLLAVAVYSVFSLLSALAPSYGALFWFRILQGVGLGMELPVAATYIAEFMPMVLRGRMVTYVTFFWSGATLLSGVLAAVLIPHYGWRSLFWVGSVPILLVAALWAFLPESVRYLVTRGEIGRAEAIVGWLTDVPVAAAVPQGKATTLGEPERRTSIARIFKGRYLRLTIGIWIIEFIAGICLFGLSTWLPSIFLKMGFGQVHSFLFSAFITGAGAIGSLIGGTLINVLGFRRSMVIGQFVGGIFLIVWAFATNPAMIVLLGIGAALFGVGAGGVAYAYMSSIYPTGTRATGVSWGGMWQRIGGIVAPSVIGILIGLRVASVDFFLALGLAWLIGGVVALTMTYEAAGRSLEEIDRELASTANV